MPYKTAEILARRVAYQIRYDLVSVLKVSMALSRLTTLVDSPIRSQLP